MQHILIARAVEGQAIGRLKPCECRKRIAKRMRVELFYQEFRKSLHAHFIVRISDIHYLAAAAIILEVKPLVPL